MCIRDREWIESLDPEKTPELTDALNALTLSSRQYLIALLEQPSKDDKKHRLRHQRSVVKSSIFPLNRLPSEILHLVLDKLTNRNDIVSLLTVCRLWALIIVKILYYRPHINKKQQLDLFMRTMYLERFETVFDYRSMIKRLNFSFVGDHLYDCLLYTSRCV